MIVLLADRVSVPFDDETALFATFTVDTLAVNEAIAERASEPVPPLVPTLNVLLAPDPTDNDADAE